MANMTPAKLLVGGLIVGAAPLAMAEVPESCQTVRFAEVGWTDITATTALASEVLEGLGYKTSSDTVSVPIAYAGMKNGDFDVFLGNWMPSMASISDPYIEKGQVDRPVANLEGAKYTLAVPQYVHDAGVTSVADLDKHADKFGHRLFGIEAGNDGNMIIQDMIDDDAFGLGDWQLVDSSEAGMLAELKSRTGSQDWMVFLGWEPHPMNTNFDMAYLEGADDYFGPNLGGATVYTNTRGGYVEECSNVGALLNNLKFTLSMENQIMGAIMDEGEDPRNAAQQWLQNHPGVLDQWLEGVTTVDGQPGLPAVKQSLGIDG
ncbi:choline ABC transporter substrate-binding protein [Modicisalibacter xianhensis]|uniref:Glycine betaine/proline transport system substrate-binding protein n=1 Tax=Modicisalibacter xianhensis TaxID=442341 RepID=A0A1I3CUE2_9GAMM|nr:choline ABC transporter substrate-binding protein [Halomonas xianhensis]SFH78053.1 glycine betaine/proline transport system substrate-binding protein [Halomonas xianhensis]